MQSRTIRIGSRGSPLALRQAHEVRDRLVAAHALDPESVSVEAIATSGDRIQDRPLREMGGKALFTKEIEQALLDGAIDLAVHSVKDMESGLPAGLGLVAMLEREDPRDVLIAREAKRLGDLPQGARLGTASLRRQAQAKRRRPDLNVVTLRGNVETRLKKLADGEADATLLALAGLKRLGLEDRAVAILEPEEMLPAAGQGAVGIEIRTRDDELRDLVAAIHHPATGVCIVAERAFLGRLEGSCRTPIAVLARLEGERLHLDGRVLTPDGAACYEVGRDAHASEAEAMGLDAAADIISRAGHEFLEGLR